MPFLSVETTSAAAQCDIWTVTELAQRDERIRLLNEQLEERNKIIDGLEKKFDNAAKMSKDSEKVRKLKFDNQILIGQLSQYKKAEKSVKEIANDYESMKMKYFNVLTENEKQKTQISDLITNQCNKDVEMRDLLKERERHIDELYGLRIDINKRINLIEDKESQVEALSKRLQCETERAQKIIAQEREVGQLKSDIKTYMAMLQQVLKHLKTLLKYLHDQV